MSDRVDDAVELSLSRLRQQVGDRGEIKALDPRLR